MRLHSLLAVVAACFVLPAFAGDTTKLELEKLQGQWKVVTLERGGKTDAPKNSIASLKGDQFTTKSGEGVVRAGTMKIDATKKPRTIDATYSSGPDKGKTLQGIYELDGDTWKIFYSEPGKDRPKMFPEKAGTAYFLLVLKREKP